MRTLEKYFRDCAENKIIDFRLRATVPLVGIRAKFYIHPEGRDGDTLDFLVDGNKLMTHADTATPNFTQEPCRYAKSPEDAGFGEQEPGRYTFTKEAIVDAFLVSRRIGTAKGQREAFFDQLGIPYVDHESGA